MSTREIAMLSMIIALSVVGRMYFSTIPNVQPTTAIIIITAMILKPSRSVIVAVLSTLITNMMLGMGIWTVWQIIDWSVIGLLSGILGKYHEQININILALYAGFCGILYGFLISLPMIIYAGMFWPYYLAGIAFDVWHGIGNIVFFYLLYPILKPLIYKYV